MKSSIFIPKTINVGYQERSDTYTGKLAYVIYYDEKGKLRKEASWNSWRDEKIPNEEFENVPTSGFVLNRRAGGVEESWGWNARKTYCRIYDPRNFEFEISIENLLYILENANSIKGKGLEGEFVYGWDGKELVLLPVESPDYKQITEYSSIMHNSESIKAKDLIVGATYLDKDNQELIYIGKFDYYSSGYEWKENGELKRSHRYKDIPCRVGGRYYEIVDYEYVYDIQRGKHYWFAYRLYDYEYVNGQKINKTTYNWNFVRFKNVPKGKLIKCIDEKCTTEYADIFDILEGRSSYSPIDRSKDEIFTMSYEKFYNRATHIRSDGVVYYSSLIFMTNNGGLKKYEIRPSGNSCGYILYEYSKNGYYNGDKEVLSIFPTKKEEVNKPWHGLCVEEHMIPVTLKEIFDKMKPVYKQTYLVNGREYEKEYSF